MTLPPDVKIVHVIKSQLPENPTGLHELPACFEAIITKQTVISAAVISRHTHTHTAPFCFEKVVLSFGKLVFMLSFFNRFLTSFLSKILMVQMVPCFFMLKSSKGGGKPPTLLWGRTKKIYQRGLHEMI